MAALTGIGFGLVQMACNESNVVSNLILRDATPFKVVTNCQPRSPMHVLIHQHRSDSVTAQKLVQFWAKMNGCTKDSIGDQPDRIVQVSVERRYRRIRRAT